VGFSSIAQTDHQYYILNAEIPPRGVYLGQSRRSKMLLTVRQTSL